MAGSLKNDDDIISEINVTPFVDVVLVLLVIFMVTAGFIMNKGVPIELPQAASAEQLDNQVSIAVLVSQNGEVFIDGKPVPPGDVPAVARESKSKGEKVVVNISADKGVAYSNVISVMDSFRQAGLSEFALQLESLPASP